MKDEKYISIEHDKWEEYYKPLEEKNKELEKELEDLKNSRRIDIHMHYGSRLLRAFDDAQVGFVEVSVEAPMMVDIPSREHIAMMLINDMANVLKENPYSKAYTPNYTNELQFMQNIGGNKDQLLLNKKDVEDALVKMDLGYIKYEKKRDEILNEEKRLKEVKQELPRIVRWLFRIK